MIHISSIFLCSIIPSAHCIQISTIHYNRPLVPPVEKHKSNSIAQNLESPCLPTINYRAIEHQDPARKNVKSNRETTNSADFSGHLSLSGAFLSEMFTTPPCYNNNIDSE